MGRPYSEDLRERIEGAIAAGHSRRAAARMFGVSPSCAVKLLQRCGRAKRGARLVAAVPHGHWKTTHLRGRAAPKQAELALRCRPADECGDLPNPRRALPRTQLAPRRHRDHGRPLLSQGQGRRRGDRSSWGEARLSAALLTRPQPDRAGLRQAQGPPATSRPTIRRSLLGTHRTPARSLHTRGVQQLFRKRRICVQPN